MSFFDQIIDTPDYQAKTLAGNQPNTMGGIPPMAPMQPVPPPQMAPAGLPGMQPQGFAKGGLAGANKVIEQTQIMKVFEHYFKNLGVDVKKGMNDLLKEIAQGLQLIPFESSVMGFKPLDGTTAQIHFFTVGTLKDLTDDMQYFFKYLKDKGIKTVYDTLPAPITTQMLVKLGAKIEQSDNPKYKLKASI
jgi:hypothetical protein